MTRPETTRAGLRKPVLLGAAWTASAAAAIGLGFLAVSLVDASASPGTAPPAAATSSTADPSAATSTASPAPSTSPSATGEMATVAGTVFANCTAGSPNLAAVPAAGWAVDDSHKADEIEFRSGSQKLEVYVVCTAGSPQFSVEGPRADGGGGDDSPTAGTSSPASETSGRDDSSGHGSGDSGGDDSSGHGRGGDDSSGDDSSGRGSDD